MPALVFRFASNYLLDSCSSVYPSSPCKRLLFYPATTFRRSLQLRQFSATGHMGMCFYALFANKENLTGFRNRNQGPCEECPTIAHYYGEEEEEGEGEEEEASFLDDSHTAKDAWMPYHNMMDEEEYPLFSADEAESPDSQWPQAVLKRNAVKDGNKRRAIPSEEKGFLGYETEDEETYDTNADKESSPGLRYMIEEGMPPYDESQNSFGQDCPSETHSSSHISRSKRKDRVLVLLSEGKDPIEVLESMPDRNAVEFWVLVFQLASEKRFGEALQAFAWWKRQENYLPREHHYVIFIRMLGRAKRPDISQQLFNEMKVLGVEAGLGSYAALLKSYVKSDCFDRAEELLREMVEKKLYANGATFNCLILAYGKHKQLDAMNKLFNNIKRWGWPPDYRTYRFMVAAYAKAGLFRRMERMWREMDKNGWKPDFWTINAIIQGYAAHGLVNEMHASYLYVKDYRVFVSEATIRAMASVYIRTSKFYQLRLVLKDVGLERRDVGNLLWNLLLLAFAANFQVKNVQRSWLGMEAAGFVYDTTTFNICGLSYSRMQMFWELHATLYRMGKAGVEPDLVTFGAVVDAYIFGRVRFAKMFEELDLLGMKELCPDVRTDPLVFEAFGKGDFHSSSETLMRVNPRPYGKSWTYGLLLSFYLRRRMARRTLQNQSQTQGSRFVAKKFVL